MSYRTPETATIEKVKEALLSLGEVLQETEAIGIFGSLARGEGFTERSDIDVFVVAKEVKPGFETDDLWYGRVREVLKKFWRGVTVLVYTVRSLEAISNWYVLRLAVEGVLVYDRGEIGKLFREIIEAAEKAGLEQRRIGDRWVWTIKDYETRPGGGGKGEMINSAEMTWRLRGAQACLGSAQRDFPAGDYRATAQNAQLCIELSARAVIAHFAEPIWDHNPRSQLLEVLREHGDEIALLGGEDVRHGLARLVEDARMAAPWHGRSTYGQRAENGSWIPALDLCTREVAEDLLARAIRSFATARGFFVEVCGGSLGS